jgi:hypothetical protein
LKNSLKMSIYFFSLSLAFTGVLLSGCSSAPTIKKQEYATLKAERVFESELPWVWEAIEVSFQDHPVVERSPQKIQSPSDWRGVASRRLKTDWIYAQSRDKYVEYTVNDHPRRQALQMRVAYEVEAKRVLGGTEVKVGVREEIQKVDSKGQPSGYRKMSDSEVDTSRQHGLLETIRLNLLR